MSRPGSASSASTPRHNQVVAVSPAPGSAMASSAVVVPLPPGCGSSDLERGSPASPGGQPSKHGQGGAAVPTSLKVSHSSHYIFSAANPNNAGRRSGQAVLDGNGEAQKSTIAILKEFDHDGDGKLDIWEVGGMVEQMTRERSHGMLLKKMLIILSVMTVLILAAVVGLSWAAAIYTKDTQVNNGVLRDKDSGNPIEVAQYLDTGKLNSELDMELLRKLRYFTMESPNGSRVSLVVDGVFKIKQPAGSPSAHVVKIVVGSMGIITLTGTTVSFESDTAAELFTAAGFSLTASGGRHLLQFGDPNGDFGGSMGGSG